MTDTNALLKQGVTALKAGQKAEARRLLEQVVQQDKDNETAWLWLSGVVDTDHERIHCLRETLRINPSNQHARRGLEMLESKAPVPHSVQPVEKKTTQPLPPTREEKKYDAQPDPAAATQPSLPSQAPSVLQKFLNEQQDPVIVQQVHKRVSQILTREEEILYIAVQNKPLVNVAPDCVVLTNRRFVIYKPKLLGGASFEDYIWRDLHDARLTEGIMGATLTMLTVHNRRISVEYLPKAQARRLYAFAQEMEEKVLEERRIRAMEEQRAAAGGITIQGGPLTAQTQAAAPAPTPSEDPVRKLKQLKDMVDAGLITEAEYEAKKVEILSRM